MAKAKIVLGVIGSDCHAVGNTIINHALEEADYDVTNIGVMSAQEEFISAALETDSDAIMVSSLYGQGELDCMGMRDNCIEAGLGDILLFVGGNIVVGKQEFSDVKNRFEKMGFNFVYPPGTPIEETIKDLDKVFA